MLFHQSPRLSRDLDLLASPAKLPSSEEIQFVVRSSIQPIAETFGLGQLNFRKDSASPDFLRHLTPSANYLLLQKCETFLGRRYLKAREGLSTPLDELNLQFLSPSKLREYALRFPRTVNDTIKDLLIETAFPSSKPNDRRDRAVR